MTTTDTPTTATTRGAGSRRTRSALLALAAALVLGATGCGDGDDQAVPPAVDDTDQTEQTPTPTPASDDTEETGETLTFVAIDLAYDQAPDEVPPGEHVLRLVNDGLLPHDVTLEELDDRTVVSVAGGETGEESIQLEPGTYTFYCDVPGHREAGMEGTLTVTEQTG